MLPGFINICFLELSIMCCVAETFLVVTMANVIFKLRANLILPYSVNKSELPSAVSFLKMSFAVYLLHVFHMFDAMIQQHTYSF